MRMSLILVVLVAVAVTSFAIATPTPVTEPGQDGWSWSKAPTNLQKLPASFTGPRLRPLMTGFTQALGVGCMHCHDGDEGQPWSEVDFASDENPNKDRARAMLDLLGDVNDILAKIEPSGSQRVNMWCHTCHHGMPRPMRLEEALMETYSEMGGEEAAFHYRELREEYFGRGAYDFSETTLNQMGYGILGGGDARGAVAIFAANAEAFPDSANAWDSLAEAHAGAGNTKEAIEFYEKSLSLDSSNENARAQVQKLKGN